MDQLVTTAVRNQGWLAMIRDQKQSGLTIKEWCARNQISEHCFYYRQQKLREMYAGNLPMFAELLPPPQPALNLDKMNSTAYIETPSLRIGLSNDASEELIRRIVGVMSHA